MDFVDEHVSWRMHMSISIQNKGNIYSNIFSKAYPQNNYAQNGFTEEEYSTRKAEYAQRLQDKSKGSVVDQAISYADQLKASRTKTKAASLEKKKLHYNFKKISSQIVRSKNSVSARKAVQTARHEVARLKRLKGSGEYDDEELQLAIDHAKSMEKVAKKKVHHLEQEEMIERAHNGFGAALEEIEEKKEENPEENIDEESEEALQDEYQDFGSLEVAGEEYAGQEYESLQYELQQEIEQAQYEMQLQMQELAEMLSENSEYVAEASENSMTEMMDEFSEEMSEMMEDMGLDELAETLYAPDPNMSEDDLKILKIKHRTKELKEIAEADKEYLKGIMEHEKSKAEKGAAMPGAGSSSPKVFSDDAPQVKAVISMPGFSGGGMEAPTTSGGFNVSV